MQPILDAVWNFFRDHSVTALTGAVGTFFGAWVALMFERWKSARADEKIRRSDLLQAQAVLICHANSLYDLRLKLDPLRLMPDRERWMPELACTFDDLSVDPRKLSFVFDSTEPDLVLNIYVADRAYHSACRTLEIMNQKGKDFRASMDIKEFDMSTGRSAGPASLPALKLLKDATDAVFQNLDDAFAQNMRMVECLAGHSKQLFPGTKFPMIDFPQLPSEAKSHNGTNKEG